LVNVKTEFTVRVIVDGSQSEMEKCGSTNRTLGFGVAARTAKDRAPARRMESPFVMW